ncbi:Protein ccc1 [Sorochytrium milnesiophthora]
MSSSATLYSPATTDADGNGSVHSGIERSHGGIASPEKHAHPTLLSAKHARRDLEAQGTARVSSTPSTVHVEKHFEAADVVRDIVIGLSDGLTVPFALSAGLSALSSPKLVVTAGLAEIVAGCISMGLGGWLAGRSEINHYDAERKREQREVREVPDAEIEEVVDVFRPYGLDREHLQPLLNRLTADEDQFVDFMMKFELNLERPSPKRSIISALTIGLSYLVGGFVPLVPYMIVDNTGTGLFISAVLTVTALLVFGYVKARVLGMTNPVSSALETGVVGVLAAGTAYGVARLVQG